MWKCIKYYNIGGLAHGLIKDNYLINQLILFKYWGKYPL